MINKIALPYMRFLREKTDLRDIIGVSFDDNQENKDNIFNSDLYQILPKIN